MAALATAALAQDQFVPPQRYPVDRYEANWNKNPFTIKTAPVALAKASFAENLAIGSYYGATDAPTIVVVNTKTGERTPLKAGAESNGMKLKSVSIQASRKETTAEVTCGGETAKLRFDDAYVRQAAARSGNQEPARGGLAQSNAPLTPGAIPNPAAARVASPAMGGGVPSAGNPALALGGQTTPNSPAFQRRTSLNGPVVPPSVITPPPSSASRVIRTAPARRILSAPPPAR